MDTVLHDKDIPDGRGISIEYLISFTSKRIEFLVAGSNGKKDNLIIVELKRWSETSLTIRDGMVNTRPQGRLSRTTHPSYRAWSYAALLQSFNAPIEEESIFVQPRAYLHNYAPDDNVTTNSIATKQSKRQSF